ncbi:MAG: carboxylating nicotinate-nucleotide diphosphorylase [Desulfovibrionaceae bacterium]
MLHTTFDDFFQLKARKYLIGAISLALEEDGHDLTSLGIFNLEETLHARIIAKEDTLVAGLPVIPLVLERCAPKGSFSYEILAEEGSRVTPDPGHPPDYPPSYPPNYPVVATMSGPAAALLKAERVILNFVTHLSGIANLTSRYVAAMGDTRTRLLDTRKTLPCLRYPEKYAVLVGGGCNHRLNLEEMLMPKDNHVDRAGGITPTVTALRKAYTPCPPIEVECRTLADVDEAVACGVNRIMLDNMDLDTMRQALARIPESIESEVSGGVTLETIAAIAAIGPDFISVGRITHSAPAADFSMRVSAMPAPQP